MKNLIKEDITNNIKVDSIKDIIKKHLSPYFDKNGIFNLENFQKDLSKNEIDFSKESYGLEWLGKSYARVLATDKARTLLKEDEEWNNKEENKNSKNILIKGDNLEVLKHLSNAYHEKIKMIYIDPPYNTGGDEFVYQDDRKFDVEEFKKIAGVDEEKANRILEFVDSKSNSHSAWLTFMYPRLYIARQLLKDDGVIFISIDDNEVAQLKLLMDEVFGENNLVSEFVWNGRSGSEDDSHIRNNKEYILCYAKLIDNFDIGLDLKANGTFIYYDELKKDYYNRQLLRKWGDSSRKEDRPNLYYAIKDDSGNDFYPILSNGELGRWRWGEKTMQKAINENKIEFADNKAYEKKFKSEEKNKTKKYQSLMLELGSSSTGTKEIKKKFNNEKIFSNPKPTILLKQILKIANTSNDFILVS